MVLEDYWRCGMLLEVIIESWWKAAGGEIGMLLEDCWKWKAVIRQLKVDGCCKAAGSQKAVGGWKAVEDRIARHLKITMKEILIKCKEI